ncbi:hypothetical protein [Salibacterium halotolerans]|uniref:Uncharacterized protein n=1 Tax=Salibacterium halotolerans TaxID=1884432 RepID=A0A1I5NNW9_9BACI|nr:hypothetical protein [Salibacterium halotolerans]SFP23350.1 hypothetical protein SAMN05518683_103221 [Salibacterium halotolerans]
MEWADLTEGAKAVLEQTRNMKNDQIQIVEFEVGFENNYGEGDNQYKVSIQEDDYENLKRFTKENEYGDKYHMARNKNIVKIILLENEKIPDNLSEFPVFRQYKFDYLQKNEETQTEEEQPEENEDDQQ